MSAYIHVHGNVGRDPEERVTKSGTIVSNFNVAHNWKDQDGADQTTWYRVSVFGKAAQFCNEKIRKGMGVLVHGEHRVSEYINSAGEKRTGNEIIFAHVTVTDWKDKVEDGRLPMDDDDPIPF